MGNAPTDEAGRAKVVAELRSHWACRRRAAEAEIRREIANDYRHTGRDYHIVVPGLIAISYGTVSKS